MFLIRGTELSRKSYKQLSEDEQGILKGLAQEEIRGLAGKIIALCSC